MSPEDREILRSVQMACVAIVSAVAVAGATIMVGGLFIQTDTAETTSPVVLVSRN